MVKYVLLFFGQGQSNIIVIECIMGPYMAGLQLDAMHLTWHVLFRSRIFNSKMWIPLIWLEEEPLARNTLQKKKNHQLGIIVKNSNNQKSNNIDNGTMTQNKKERLSSLAHVLLFEYTRKDMFVFIIFIFSFGFL